MAKRHPIGLGHVNVLCRMSHPERLAFLAEGLPIILASAEGFWEAAGDLWDRQPREAEVLAGFASEEAAKILILVDMLRCPATERSNSTGIAARRFYDHFARLLYAAAVDCRPADRAELRRFMDSLRPSHVVDGPDGYEYILPWGPIHRRERLLYADVEALDDGKAAWNTPRSWREGMPPVGFLNRLPAVLTLTRSMERLGLFTEPGLCVIADAWACKPLDEETRADEMQELTQQALLRLDACGGIAAEASDEDARLLHELWPFPMSEFDLKSIPVCRDELEAERDRRFWQEAGVWE